MPNFKLKEINIFGSVEDLYNNVKKYRRIYDETEATYIYCEIVFYNKLFDEGNWIANVTLNCFNHETNEQLCNLNKTIPVNSDINIMYVREGWGTPQPTWWKKGKYRWSISIDGIHVGDTFFYITDAGVVTADNNPYFDISSIKLYESAKTNVPFGQREYMSAFKNDARYINAEISLRNKLPNAELYPLELQFNFINDAGQHKAYAEINQEYKNAPETFILEGGYGSETRAYWFADDYFIEVRFMDCIFAVVPFSVGSENISAPQGVTYRTQREKINGNPPVIEANPQNAPPQDTGKPTFEQAKTELEELVGLQSVKEQIDELATYLQFLQLRQQKGFKENQRFALNTVFTGNPGTGKTTVARLLGKIYHSMGLLSNGKVVEVGRADLVGEFIGQTAPKVKKAIESAKGGILFIDEAYSLSDRGDDSKDFGKEVMEVLLKEMEGQPDIAFVFAGYPKEMQQFLNFNPGLASRLRNVIHFPDYSPDELMQIATYTTQQRGVAFSDEAKAVVHRKIVEAYRNRTDNFGNGRFVNSIIDEAKQNMAIRLMRDIESVKDYNEEQLSTITLADIEKIFGKNLNKTIHLPIDDPMLQDALSQLNELIGLDDLKKQILETVKLSRYYKEIGKDVTKSFSLHSVFTGNPGTGKTTVARIFAQIFKALGILEKGHLVETDRRGLVAEFIGQTAVKTGALIDSAIGGCLFIDEAYSLTQGYANDFGREAVETLLKRMEDQRGEFMVIVAGYTDEMKKFIEMNPGLMSRFDKTYTFADYTEQQLVAIAHSLFAKEDLTLSQEAEQHIQALIAKMLGNKHKYFGNGRTIRKMVEETVRAQNLRIADTPAAQRNHYLIHTITLQDVQSIKINEQDDNSKKIGFNK